MRRIKFRAWDKERLCFLKPIETTQLVIRPISGKITDGAVDVSEKIELLQYTGLKDKNGKEIYEGDIVKRTYLFNGGYGETHTGEVVYDKGYARYVISRPKKHIEPKTEDLRNTLSDISTYEVIGNIYENPEILEESAK